MTKTIDTKYNCGNFSRFTYYNNNKYEDVSDNKLFDKFFLKTTKNQKKPDLNKFQVNPQGFFI